MSFDKATETKVKYPAPHFVDSDDEADLESLESLDPKTIEASRTSEKRRRQEPSETESEEYRQHKDAQPGSLNTRLSATLGVSDQPCHLLLHRVACNRLQTHSEDHSGHHSNACYIDPPRLFRKDTRATQLRGKTLIDDVEEYLEEHRDVVFVVYRDYSCDHYHQRMKDEFRKQVPDLMARQLFLQHRPWFYSLAEDMPLAKRQFESIQTCGEELENALNTIVTSRPDIYGPWNDESNFQEPYNYFFHHQASMREDGACLLTHAENQALLILLNYIQASRGKEFADAEESFNQGILRKKHLPKLFRVNDIVVQQEQGQLQALRVESVKVVSKESVLLRCYLWTFHVKFQKRQVSVEVNWPKNPQDKVSITQLSAWPLRLDKNGLSQQLQKRGEMLWKCRTKRLVSYDTSEIANFELRTTYPKYMVDMATYRYLYPMESPNVLDEGDEVDPTLDDPPPEPFLILLPPTVLGYGFHDKKWRTLQVDALRDVPWNKKAFDRLVLKPHKKELIQALVTVHLEKSQSADIVEGKGNGLILLLHGPPGTGKTLTAETVAELAEKPLYRIDCGDIGTDPEGVEKYLESALFVGTIWSCVVLLDEADVFLEERTQNDLQRNALVSCFLRVLEYYDGILILTSNRVGTFDEAFKSRMQLAVRYPVLEEQDRYEIWLNFLDALKAAEVEMDYDELRRKASILARDELNGRQIRNTIKTARQLAAFRKQNLAYGHLASAIEVAKEFEDYLVEIKGHTDEQYATDSKIR